jgi:hypothetical protein
MDKLILRESKNRTFANHSCPGPLPPFSPLAARNGEANDAQQVRDGRRGAAPPSLRNYPRSSLLTPEECYARSFQRPHPTSRRRQRDAGASPADALPAASVACSDTVLGAARRSALHELPRNGGLASASTNGATAPSAKVRSRRARATRAAPRARSPPYVCVIRPPSRRTPSCMPQMRQSAGGRGQRGRGRQPPPPRFPPLLPRPSSSPPRPRRRPSQSQGPGPSARSRPRPPRARGVGAACMPVTPPPWRRRWRPDLTPPHPHLEPSPRPP